MPLIILAVYIIGIFVTLYLMGRNEAEEIAPLALLWPLAAVLAPFIWLGYRVLRLGDTHRMKKSGRGY